MVLFGLKYGRAGGGFFTHALFLSAEPARSRERPESGACLMDLRIGRYACRRCRCPWPSYMVMLLSTPASTGARIRPRPSSKLPSGEAGAGACQVYVG